MGSHANLVVTHGDTIAGLKYIGRRFVADCFAADKPRRRAFPSRLALQLSLANETAKVIRRVRREEQLA
jgi:hypothetical protein